MVDIHHYLNMSHSHKNLLVFRNSYLSNQFDRNIQMLRLMFRYMFLKKKWIKLSFWKNKRDTIIPTSIWFTGSIIILTLWTIKTMETCTIITINICICVITGTIILTGLQHITWSWWNGTIYTNCIAIWTRWYKKICWWRIN